MSRCPPDQPLLPRTGPATVIVASVILAPLGLLSLCGRPEIMRLSVLSVSIYCDGCQASFAFLAFCLALHIYARRLWDWHVRAVRMQYFRKQKS